MASSSKSGVGKHDQMAAGRHKAFRKMTAVRPAPQLVTERESAPVIETISTPSHPSPRPPYNG